jgi:hypothetical protein
MVLSQELATDCGKIPLFYHTIFGEFLQDGEKNFVIGNNFRRGGGRLMTEG